MSFSPSRKSGSAPPAGGSAGGRVRTAAPGVRISFCGRGGILHPRPRIPAGACRAWGRGARGCDLRGWGARGPGSPAPKKGQGPLRDPPRGCGPDGRTLSRLSSPGSSAPCPRIPIKVLCGSAHFQPISHEEACWPPPRRMESCRCPAFPGSPGP